jgi:PBSX family phage terminase large subunit
MRLSPIQQQVANDNHRFKVVIGGRRMGKTFLAIREMCYQARLPNRLIWYVTSSYRAAKMIAFKELKQRLIDLNWVRKINESELSVTLKNNTTIALKGADNFQSLRGIKLSYCVIDEAAQVQSDAFYEVIRPALADSQGGVLFISTPLGKNNWTFDLYNKEKEDPDNWKSWQFTTLEGGFVSDEEIEQARQDMSEKQFNQEFNATFESFGDQVAWAFNRDENIKELPNADLRTIYIGMDFNVAPINAAIMVREGEDLYIIDEIQMYSSNTDELATEIKRRYPNSKVFVYPDPSGAARKTSANGHTDFTILTNAGFNVKAPRRHDPVRDRINALNARLRSADGKNHLFVSKRCKYSIESLEKYCFKPGTQIPDKDSGFDHMFDAISYCVAFIFPLQRVQEPFVPERWGQKIGTPFQQIR